MANRAGSRQSSRVHDTWYTTGLCGSGSNDYSIHDVFVPAGHMFSLEKTNREETLYRWPPLFIANLVAVPLGVAAHALCCHGDPER